MTAVSRTLGHRSWRAEAATSSSFAGGEDVVVSFWSAASREFDGTVAASLSSEFGLVAEEDDDVPDSR